MPPLFAGRFGEPVAEEPVPRLRSENRLPIVTPLNDVLRLAGNSVTGKTCLGDPMPVHQSPRQYHVCPFYRLIGQVRRGCFSQSVTAAVIEEISGTVTRLGTGV